ncbi:MAG: hypothetical protein U5O15_07685 [Candidatus Krumholzibacteriota bacterium]|nr:hypothetical protein [Candidatus Krumholzibacteriota bacterium]
MRSLNFKVTTILVLSVCAVLVYGCSEENMIKPPAPAEQMWEALDNKIENSGGILSMKFNSSDDLYVLTLRDSRALYYKDHNSQIWGKTDSVNVDSVLYTIRSFAFNNSDELFVGTKEGVIFSSVDYPDNLSVIDTLGVGLFIDVRSMISTDEGYIFAAVSGAGIYRSEDKGGSWTNVGLGLENKDFIRRGLVANSAGDIYSASWGGDVYKGENNGSDWNSLNTFITEYFPDFINCIDIREDDKLIGGYEGFFCYYETDPAVVDSSMWIPQNNGFPENSGQSVDIRCLAVNSDGTIYAGNYGSGIFRSTDHGVSWEAINGRLTDLQIQDIAIRSDGKVFIANLNGDIYRSIW